MRNLGEIEVVHYRKMCWRHNILITPHQTTEGSAVWGSKGALWRCVSKTHHIAEASGSRAVTLWQPHTVAYLWYADIYRQHRHPKLRPSALLGVNRILCFQHISHPAHYSSPTAHRPQLIAHSSSPTAHRPQLIAHCSQLTAHSSQLIAHSSLLTAHCKINLSIY